MKNQEHVEKIRFKLGSFFGLLVCTFLIFIGCCVFLQKPSFWATLWQPTLVVKWDQSLQNEKLADSHRYFWLLSSYSDKQAAIEAGIPERKLVLDLRRGLELPNFSIEQALFNDASLANTVVGKQVLNAWFQRKSGREWCGFNWVAEVIEYSGRAWTHYLNSSKIILINWEQLVELSVPSDRIPQWHRKFLPGYDLILVICFVVAAILVHPFAVTGCLIIIAQNWNSDLKTYLDALLICVLVSIFLSHVSELRVRKKIGFAETTAGLLHAIYLWPLRVLFLSAVMFLSGWYEDLGNYFIDGSTYGLHEPHEAMFCLMVAYLLIWLISFCANFAMKIIFSALASCLTIAYLSLFHQGQIDFFTNWIVSSALLIVMQLVMITLVIIAIRFRERSGIAHLGYFGFGNLGDDLLLLCQLGRQQSSAKHYIISASLTDIPVECDNHEVIHRQDFAGILSCLAKCEYLSLGPGGILQDKSSQSSLIYYLSFGFLARFLGCRWMWLGQGCSPLKFASSKLMVFLSSNLVSRIEVRDKASIEYLQSIGISSNKIEEIRDLVWDLNFTIKHTPKKSLAVVLRRWPNAPLENWIKELMRSGWQRKYFLFEKDKGLESLIRSNDSKASIFVYRGNWRDFLRQFYTCSHVLSMRYHGLILGLKESRKCFSLAYDEKCKGVEIDPKFTMDPSNWQSLFPKLKEFMETN